MARNRLPWFPIDPVEMMTDRRFSTLDDAQHGRALRGAYYLWVYGQWPGDGSAESEKLRLIVQPWLNAIKDAQEARAKRVSEKNKANVSTRYIKDLSTTGIRPYTTGYHREGEVEGDREGKPTTTTTLAPNGAGLLGFDDFWKSYPRKIGKGQAEKWWKRNRPNQDILQAMLGALEWQRITPEWKKERGKYIPHPTTWLNGKRWEDEPGRQAAQEDAPPPERGQSLKPSHCFRCGGTGIPLSRIGLSWNYACTEGCGEQAEDGA